jgi:glutaminyl-peptide cyclotransferase
MKVWQIGCSALAIRRLPISLFRGFGGYVRARIACLAAVGLLLVTTAIAAPVAGYKVVAKLPHSTENYTEGFFFLDGLFYEGTGLQGHSAVIATTPATGKVQQRVDLPEKYFGEGIVDWGPNIYEWTWKSQVCFVYDRFSLRLIRQLAYDGEGWGMTRTATQIITSDGSSTLSFRDPGTFKVLRHIVVKDRGKPVDQLNELEYVKGEIYANVWLTDRIARISPVDGHVIGWIDLAGLLPDDQRINGESVLNGIAYDSKGDRLFVTGKQWPTIFEIQVVPKQPTPLHH